MDLMFQPLGGGRNDYNFLVGATQQHHARSTGPVQFGKNIMRKVA